MPRQQKSPWKRFASSPKGRGVIAVALVLIAIWAIDRLWNSRYGLLSDHHDLPKDLTRKEASDPVKVGKHLEEVWKIDKDRVEALQKRVDDPANPYASLHITAKEAETAADFAATKAAIAANLGGVTVDQAVIKRSVIDAFTACARKNTDTCDVTTPAMALEGGNAMQFEFHIKPTEVYGARLGLVDMLAMFNATSEEANLHAIHLEKLADGTVKVIERMEPGKSYVAASAQIVPDVSGMGSLALAQASRPDEMMILYSRPANLALKPKAQVP